MFPAVSSEAACAASVATMCACVATEVACAAMMSSGGVVTLGVYFSPHGLALLASLNQLWRLNHFLNSSVNLLHSSMDCLTVVAGSGISSVMASSGIACSGKSSVMASSVASVSGTRMAIAMGLPAPDS